MEWLVLPRRPCPEAGTRRALSSAAVRRGHRADVCVCYCSLSRPPADSAEACHARRSRSTRLCSPPKSPVGRERTQGHLLSRLLLLGHPLLPGHLWISFSWEEFNILLGSNSGDWSFLVCFGVFIDFQFRLFLPIKRFSSLLLNYWQAFLSHYMSKKVRTS